MPPSCSTGPKSYVYAVTRNDFVHHIDQKGRLVLVKVHASISSANATAKAHLLAQPRKAGALDAEIEEMRRTVDTMDIAMRARTGRIVSLVRSERWS